MFMHFDDCAQFDGRDPSATARSLRTAKKKAAGTARRLGFRTSRAKCGGFSLVELMVSMLVLGVIMGAVVSALSTSEEVYSTTELQSDMYENVRGAAELMEQEVGQAGLLTLPPSTLTTAAAIGTNSPTVSSTASMFVGEQVLVDAGSGKEELVSLAAPLTSTAITATFTIAHASGAPITVLGSFPNGVVVPGTTDGSTLANEPGVSVLNLFGDINSDGTLVYVRYTCDTSVTPGTLTRSVTTITPGNNTINAAQTLLSTLIPNPNNTPCFQYTQYTAGAAGTPVVTNVGLTISVQSLKPDPHTGQYLKMTKSFLDLSPRNVLAAFELANAALTTRLQPTPPNVLLY
jgi:prepilin-type N-terminal cleavage/methylation domain-containing protein